MRKIYFIAALLIFALSCDKADEPDYGGPMLTFRAMGGDEAETRTALRQNGGVVWSPSDEIMIYYGTQSGKFTSTNTSETSTAEFKGRLGALNMDGNESFLGVYPYSAARSNDVNAAGDGFSAYLPYQQTAVEGGFADDLFLSAARSLNFDLYFYNLCGGIKFSVAVPGIVRIAFTANGKETLAGTGYYDFPLGSVPSFSHTGSDARDHVVVSAPDGGTFKPGAWYYMVMFPRKLSQGYTIDLYNATNLAGTIENKTPVEIKRGRWGVLKDLGVTGTPESEYEVYATRNYNGESNLVEALVDRSGDYRLNPDKTRFYPTKFRYTFGDEQFVLPDIFYTDADCENKNRITSCVATNLSNNDHYIFVFEKDDDPSHYSMTGYMYVVNNGSITRYSQVFSEQNTGWFPYFEYNNGLQLHFFSYSGYYAETASINEDGAWTVTRGSFTYPDDFQQLRAGKESIYFFIEASQGAAELHSTPNALDFGTVSVGSSSTKSFQVTNIGDAGSQMDMIIPDGFSVSPSPKGTIKSGETKSFTVTFTPTEARDYSDYIHISFDGGVAFVTLTATGEGASGSQPEAVDLGLSVKWASCNLDASSPEEMGSEYAWGETESKDYSSWGDYTWCIFYDNPYMKLSKYNWSPYYGIVDNKRILEPEDDAAHKKLGGKWRIPTKAEFDELIANCTWTWTKQNGTNGYLVQSNINNNSIFIPCKSYTYYWASELGGSPTYAQALHTTSSDISWSSSFGREGTLPIRPVTPSVDYKFAVSSNTVELHTMSGLTASTTIQLYNTGDKPITISSINCPSFISAYVSGGNTIQPCEMKEIDITFSPIGQMVHVTSPITITANGLSESIAVDAIAAASIFDDYAAAKALISEDGISVGFSLLGNASIEQADGEEEYILVFHDVAVGGSDEEDSIYLYLKNNKDCSVPIRYYLFGAPDCIYNMFCKRTQEYINVDRMETLDPGRKGEDGLFKFIPKEKRVYTGEYYYLIVYEKDGVEKGFCWPFHFKGKGI